MLKDVFSALSHTWSAKFGELLIGATKDALDMLDQRLAAVESQLRTPKATKAPKAPKAPEAPKDEAQ